MKFSEYMKAVLAYETDYANIPKGIDVDDARIAHIGLGIANEKGELAGAIKKAIYGKEVDAINVLEECGDFLWFVGLSFSTAFDGVDNENTEAFDTMVEEINEQISKKGKILDSDGDLLGAALRICSGDIDGNVADDLTGIAVILNYFGYTLQDAMAANINKLKARYGDKYDEVKAVNRNLDLERSALEMNSVSTTVQ